jgi:hypothetical protein
MTKDGMSTAQRTHYCENADDKEGFLERAKKHFV